MPLHTIALLLRNQLKYILAVNELNVVLRQIIVSVTVLRKTLVNDRIAGDDGLLGFCFMA